MKKRFELFEEELRYWIHDHETKKNYGDFDLDCLEDLLNEQDKKIKELENGIKMLKGIKRYDIGELLIENIKLKQSQNKKVIEVLESMKKFYNSNSDCDWIIDCCELEKYINNQIAEFKERQ